MHEHWLARASSIRVLWRAFLVLLVLAVLAELFVESKPLFAVEGVFAFAAWYGLAACAVLILLARALGALVKRPDSYYEGDHGAD